MHLPQPLAALLASHTICFLVYLAWTHAGLHRPWWLRIINTLAPWLFLPVLALPLLIPVHRGVLYSIVSFAAAAFYCWRYLWFLPHRLDDRPSSGAVVSVLTANLLKTNRSLDAVVDAILAETPDVLAIQELQEHHIPILTDRLGQAYPYRGLNPGRDSEGIGILSRLPLRCVRVHQASPAANPTIVAQISVGDSKVWVVNVHTRIPELVTREILGAVVPVGLDTAARRSDLEDLVTLVESLPGHALIVGDLNTTAECSDFRAIPPQWVDSFRSVGRSPGFTFPVREPFFGVRLPVPLFRIDYAFYRGEWQVIAARTGSIPGSDHRYLIVDLQPE